MSERMLVIEEGPDHLVFQLGSGLYAFFVEAGLLVELDPVACLEGDELSGAFQGALYGLLARLGEEEGTSRALVRLHAEEFEPRISALNLNLTDKCNLACIYCYAKGGDYERITHDLDVEPIVLLKVVCPSTAKVHVLRVPPDSTHCETARRWTFFDVNQNFDIIAEA